MIRHSILKCFRTTSPLTSRTIVTIVLPITRFEQIRTIKIASRKTTRKPKSNEKTEEIKPKDDKRIKEESKTEREAKERLDKINKMKGESIADRLSPAVIQESLGVSSELFAELQKKIDFHGDPFNVIYKLVEERVFPFTMCYRYERAYGAEHMQGFTQMTLLEFEVIYRILEEHDDDIVNTVSPTEHNVDLLGYFYNSSDKVIPLSRYRYLFNPTISNLIRWRFGEFIDLFKK